MKTEKFNLLYECLTNDKYDSLGKEMTVREALDLWWNSIRIRTADGILCCYKRHDGSYELNERDILDKRILLDGEWLEDGDGYPIVFATLLEDK